MTKSPRRLKEQVRDTVGEQVRDLPLHAVRLAMFGVGRALLLSDRVTKDYKEITEGGGVGPVIGRLRDDVQHTAGKVVGHVVERVRGEEPEPEPAPKPARSAPARAPERPRARAGEEIAVGKPAAAPKPAPRPAPKPAPKPTAETRPKPAPAPDTKPEFEPKPEAKPAAPAEAAKLAADLPVPDYDQATLPQLRARLRGLSADQVKLLREYERKHAARPDVLRMYENRIAKLNGLS
ncbi:hypothetical protein [Actinomadura viridis]|uniref:DUF8129 domain-containing protein n=1 Tax=Actinomadura viridis TaxID=58110 RepID=A0A931GHR3_9ACTN|nr:hypothetical protein [Actinomadura viridis]MBG6087182.1 hypothetical protein [Actinomadura viridis]